MNSVSLSELEKTIGRLRRELAGIFQSWAVFEAGNGYPTSNAREGLRQRINENREGWGISQVTILAARDTIMALSRILEEQGKPGKSRRESLSHVGSFIRKPGAEDFLANLARGWTPGIGEDQNERLVRKRFLRLRSRLLESPKGARNIYSIRQSVLDLRNKQLAHALNSEITRLPKVHELRDGVVFAAVCIRDASLIISGIDSDPGASWRGNLKLANSFWDRYEKGFNSHSAAIRSAAEL